MVKVALAARSLVRLLELLVLAHGTEVGVAIGCNLFLLLEQLPVLLLHRGDLLGDVEDHVRQLGLRSALDVFEALYVAFLCHFCIEFLLQLSDFLEHAVQLVVLVEDLIDAPVRLLYFLLKLLLNALLLVLRLLELAELLLQLCQLCSA